MTTPHAVDHLAVALAQAELVVAALSPADAARPTPCRSWDVGTLLDHLLVDLSRFTATARDEQVDWSAPTPHVPPEQWLPALRAGRTELLDAWGGRDSPALGMQVAEVSLHTWDLTRATGQRVQLDPAPAETGLVWMRGMLQPGYRGTEEEGKAFGPEQPAPPGAGAYERLAAFSGRDVYGLDQPRSSFADSTVNGTPPIPH
ncbi:MAG: uncharacterized protein JWL64_2636 [Frankiales bacterium]|nr:uncharacterized protein [Frankiales bacterium]